MKRPLNLSMIIIVCLLAGCSKKEANTTAEALEVAESGQAVTEQPTKTEAPEAAQTKVYTLVDWVDLIPDDDLQALENPPAYLNEIEDGSAEDSLPSQLKTDASPAQDRYQQALNSKQIRPEFNGRDVRIPGFIVPLEYDDQQTVTTFFLVPFFGACLHMPPPPPNQIIYAEYEPGIRLDALYDPFWIEGTLSTSLIENDLATAAYSISADTITPYYENTEESEGLSE